MEEYDTRDYKLALCLESGRAAKVAGVQEWGLGEDLTFTLFGWVGNRLGVISTLASNLMAEPQPRRIERVANAARILRLGWGVDEFVFMAEGFVSSDSEKSVGKDLRALFTEKDSPVEECLTLSFITATDWEVVTAPYRLGLGRKVEWLPLMRTRDSQTLRDSVYPRVIQASLTLMKVRPPEHHPDIFYETLAAGLEDEGFGTQWEFD